MERSRSKILIAAGGTGGHLFPAQALAQEFQQKNESVEILFAGAGLKTNRNFYKEQFPHEEIVSATLFRSKKQLFTSVFKLFKGIRESFHILSNFQPDVVVGFGSFHVFPLLAAAFFKRIPIVLFESNSEPGKVNRLFSRCAVVSAVQFSEAAKRMMGPTVEVKMPIWEKPGEKNSTVQEARSYFGLSADILTFLVFGGSQGSVAINAVFCEAALALQEKHVPFQVIHIAGKTESGEQVKRFYEKHGIRACVKEFEDRMNVAWRAASLVICRAGAATMAEQIDFEVPGILIPYPFAADQHQKKNAMVMQQQVQGGVCLLEEDCDPQNLLHEIEKLIDGPGRLEAMRQNIRSFKEKENKKDLYSIICNFLEG